MLEKLIPALAVLNVLILLEKIPEKHEKYTHTRAAKAFTPPRGVAS